ncbi:MAG: DUF87 domain-containing protein [bacterium]|nr:DUF87 domain-containing protein [bacterium]
MQDFERPATFYLGRPVNPEDGAILDEPLLYGAKDLCTHALIVGMTGSGKTGLGVGLLEEAALDGIPSLVIDPKGDMSNLMLQFPDLTPEQFEPWVDPGEAARKGQSVEEFAANTAEMWRAGLEKWGQTPERIQRLRDSAEFSVYTPGLRSGRPLRVLKSFAAPPAMMRENAEAMEDRAESSVTALLALIGVDADPLQSREAILLSNILLNAWRAGDDLDLARLITQVQDPPFDRLGVLEVESFFSKKERFKLAMTLNNMLASPGFGAWMEGDAMDVQSMLYTNGGKPKVTVLSLAHLSDAERMFFVSILLGEVVAWMRTQPGTSSLRALLYMDEIFGFFPPTAQPPSKKPMMTLLKQARAFGLGCVLSTQNPVDLDYKGLSNCGSWFLGRLQTERDKARVLDGLEGAMTEGGKAPSRSEMDALLSGLGKRVFLLNNVHDDGPVTFHTRWVMSYLRGPMTRLELQELCGQDEANPIEEVLDPPTKPSEESTPEAIPKVAEPPQPSIPTDARPRVADGVEQCFLPSSDPATLFAPTLLARVDLHYVSARADVDLWKNAQLQVDLPANNIRLELDGFRTHIDSDGIETETSCGPNATFAPLTSEASKKTTWRSWKASIKNHLYQNQVLTLWRSPEFKLVSEPGETREAFLMRVKEAAQEECDRQLEKLTDRYDSKLDRVREKVRKAEQKVAVQEDQYDSVRTSMWSRVGGILVSLLGRKRTRRQVASAARNVSRARKEKSDIHRAEADLDQSMAELADLEREFKDGLEAIRDGFAGHNEELDDINISPRKSDIHFEVFSLVWVPGAGV